METKNTKSPKARKLRGWATYEGDEFSFRPCEEGEPTQLNVRSVKGGKLFTTKSAKKPLQVAHLSCPADAADPWHEYTSQLKKLGIKPQQPVQQPDSLRVVYEKDLECWLDEKKQEVTFRGTISLERHFRSWQAELLRQLQLIVRRLPANERFCKTINDIKTKGGTKNV